MRLFLSDDGRAGFALKGDDIVSVFKHSESGLRRASRSMLSLAKEQGGRRLDAFDTFLPDLYSKDGFRAVARLPWDDAHAPEGWDFGANAQFNAGRPDVVFMVHDPEASAYHPGDGAPVTSYEDGVKAQDRALGKPGDDGPGGVPSGPGDPPSGGGNGGAGGSSPASHEAGPNPNREAPGTTAAETRNADTEAARAAEGLDPVQKQHYTTGDEGDELGRQAIANGADHVKLAEEVAKRPRALTPEENGILKEGLSRLYDQRDAARGLRDAATKAGDDAAAAVHHQEYLRVRDLIDRNTEALVKGGRESSASLAARRGAAPVDASDPEALIQEARWKKGDGTKPGELTSAEREAFEKLASDHRAAQARIAELEASASERAAEEAIKPKGAKGGRSRAPRSAEDIRASRAAATERLKAKIEAHQKAALGRANSAGAVVGEVAHTLYDIAPEIVQIAKDYGEEGVQKLGDVVAKVREHVKALGLDLSEKDVHDALSGNYERPRSAVDRPKAETQLKAWRGEIAERRKAERRAKAAVDRSDAKETARISNEATARARAEDAAETRRLMAEQAAKDRAGAKGEAAARKAEKARLDQADRAARDERKGAMKEALKSAGSETWDPLRKAAYEEAKWKRIAEGLERRKAFGEAREARKAQAKAFSDVKEAARKQAQAERGARRKAYEDAFGERSRLEASISDLQRKLDLIGPPEPKKVRTQDPELAAEYRKRDALQAEAKARIEAARPLSIGEKGARAHGVAVLSGPGIVAKLAGATAAHLPAEALAEIPAAAARGLRVKGTRIGDVALGEARSRMSTYGKGLSQFLKGDTYRDALQKAKTGVNSLDAAAIARNQIHAEARHPILDLVGNVHGAIKTPLQRASYEMAIDKRTFALERQGIDLSKPEEQYKLVAGAYADSLNAILKGDNRLTKVLNDGFGSIEKHFGKGAGAFARTLAPVTKVPANFVGKSLQSTGLGLFEGMYRQIKAGKAAEALTPEAADAIVRAYKRGGVGMGLLALVGVGAVDGPGYYRRGINLPDGEHFGDQTVFGVHVPHSMAHNPLSEAMNVMLTAKHAFEDAAGETYKTGDRRGEAKRDGFGAGGAALLSVANGLSQGTPGFQQGAEYFGALHSEHDAGKALGRYFASYNPQAVQAVAKATDPVKRDDGGFVASIAAGIPGLRETLPPKASRKRKN